MRQRRGKPVKRDVDIAVITTVRREFTMSLLLLIVLVLFLVGGLPNFGYHSYGYFPSGLAGVLVVVLLVLLLTGRL
jgi:hypothetical protein